LVERKPSDVLEEQWLEFPDPDDSLERECEEFLYAMAEGHEACRTL
jgi:hypothetical protein